MRVKTVVTEQHIARGTRRSSDSCPIALAVAEALSLPLNEGVEVNPSDIAVVYAGRLYVCDLPATAMAFIDTFDEGQPVSPLPLDLELVLEGA